jgi:hypothetical protein
MRRAQNRETIEVASITRNLRRRCTIVYPQRPNQSIRAMPGALCLVNRSSQTVRGGSRGPVTPVTETGAVNTLVQWHKPAKATVKAIMCAGGQRDAERCQVEKEAW